MKSEGGTNMTKIAAWEKRLKKKALGHQVKFKLSDTVRTGRMTAFWPVTNNGTSFEIRRANEVWLVNASEIVGYEN
jgi:hypothetical protein